MTTLIALGIIILAFLIFWGSNWFSPMQRLRKRGLLKTKNPTMFDVRRLIVEGHKDEAVELYTFLFKVTRKEAKKNVNDIEKHIQEKHQI